MPNYYAPQGRMSQQVAPAAPAAPTFLDVLRMLLTQRAQAQRFRPGPALTPDLMQQQAVRDAAAKANAMGQPFINPYPVPRGPMETPYQDYGPNPMTVRG